MIATTPSVPSFDALEARLDELLDSAARIDPLLVVTELIGLAEDALVQWVEARGEAPTNDEKEGFRLLALQRQGSKGDPSFNACRESCRELVYHFNLIADDTAHPDISKRVNLAILVARHIVYFVSGKMQVEGLGEFCCASKPVRSADGVAPGGGT